MTCVLGDSKLILFWEDKWLQGSSLRSLAPELYDRVPVRVRRKHLVADALANNLWICDLHGSLGVQAILQYLHIWSLLRTTTLSEGHPDSFIWRWESSESYSAQSAYLALFAGRISF
ncbi:Os04g0117000 [Oryza sativa Japonica Group]|uniref:Os04g0117000 protein n=1 Tax=Oryza sativa subsp. japonica TaxID=39947 RepID=A0A0P0W680_ORYSJ|nr:Os04g0117000 [Oryza sativa Japonica Group]